MSLNLVAQDTTKSVSLLDSTILDSLHQDSLHQDSLVLRGFSLYVLSTDSIEIPVDYGAQDSIVFDYDKKLIYLYGTAFINYTTIQLKADYIVIDMNSSIATAEPRIDTLGHKIGVPKFKDGDQTFDAQKLRYNFKTKKGIITEIVTKENDIFILGNTTKFISKQAEHSEGDDIIYNKNGIFTTCDQPIPHFGIYSNKQKIIPNKLIIIGPSIVKIKGVPLPPLMLPFGFFPISKNKSAGLIIPKDYDYDDKKGFGIRNIGYYLPINDHLDATILSDIYFKGSFGIKVNSNYKKKYKYDGNFEIGYSRFKEELNDSYKTNIISPISITWYHRQAQNAHPYQNLGGNIHITTSGYDRANTRDAYNQQNNILTSNLNYTRTFPNSPWSLTASMNHSQNLQTKIINITLPQLDIRMRQINPLKNKRKVGGSDKWYEQITLNYNTSFKNSVTTFDSILFEKEILDKLQYGVKHSLSSDVSFKLLKYFNLSPSVRYDEEWFFRAQELSFNPDSIFNPILDDSMKLIRIDTIYGKIDTQITKGFYPLRTFSANANLSTQLFGQILSKKGWFRGIRHQVMPAINFNFAPNYHKSPYNYFKQVDTDSRDSFNKSLDYLIYTHSPFGSAGVPGENFNINFSLNNRVELKYYSKKDSTSKKLALIEGLGLNGSYNVFADSFKLSLISGSGRNTFFKGHTNITYGISLDPYEHQIINGKDVRKDKYAIKTQGKLAYISFANLGIYNNITIQQLMAFFKKGKPKDENLPSLGDVFSNFSIQHNLQYLYTRLNSGKDTLYQSVHSINLNGSIPLTKNWKVNVGQIGYDILRKGFSYPDFGLERDLHCWTMKFQYYPSAKAFSFFIGVKPGSLEFIKIPNNQNLTGGGR